MSAVSWIGLGMVAMAVFAMISASLDPSHVNRTKFR